VRFTSEPGLIGNTRPRFYSSSCSKTLKLNKKYAVLEIRVLAFVAEDPLQSECQIVSRLMGYR
jgi:hypothetical protein